MNNVNLKDKSKEILEKINEIKGCLDELIGDKESLISEKSYNTCQSCLEEITEEIAPYAQDNMPELRNGMFGIAKCLPDGNINAFYVTEDTIIYENGNWDLHSIFDENGKSGYTQILALYSEDVKSFKGVWAFYYDIDNPNPSDLIWKKID